MDTRRGRDRRARRRMRGTFLEAAMRLVQACLLALLVLFLVAPPAWADDCSSPSDCVTAPGNIDLATGLAAAAAGVVISYAVVSRMTSAPPLLPFQRAVSTGFAHPDRTEAPMEPMLPLASGREYYFWLELGPPVSGSAGAPEGGAAGPPPEDVRLTVALFGFEGELQVTPDADVGELRLRADGSAQVTRQPAGESAISADSERLSRRLFFPVRPPDASGTFRLRCNIYHEQVLVQSRLVRARVVRRGSPMGWALRSAFEFLLARVIPRPAWLRSVVDYSASQTLDPTRLAGMAPHRLSVLFNNGPNGTHNFWFFGEQELKQGATFDGQELQDLIEQARGALRLAAWGDERSWQAQAYRYEGPRNRDQLRADLAPLARRGYRFYFRVTQQIAGSGAQVRALTELMLKPGLVQIASVQSARFVLPAALIYDYPLDTNADAYDLCPTFERALAAGQPLEALRCFQGECESRGNLTTICPSGFWGYRHELGLPLSLVGAPEPPTVIAGRDEPRLAVGVSTDPAFTLRLAHEQALQAMGSSDQWWNYADTREEAFTLLRDTRAHVVYFYCHGGSVKNVPYIQVGPPGEKGITPDNLLAYSIYWEAPRPLVFINGCRTTALEPEAALEFVGAFVETAGASGVIGTEITIFEPLARAFAEECLRRFVAGAPLGAAVRGARLTLLQAGNPLGLAYIPFALASLKLAEQPGVQ